jgi:hypothetical protein
MAVRFTARHMLGGTEHQHIAALRWIEDGTSEVKESTREVLVEWVRDKDCGVRRIRPPSSAESDQADRLNPTTQFGVSDHLGEDLAAA